MTAAAPATENAAPPAEVGVAPRSRIAPRTFAVRVWVDAAVILILTALGVVGLSTAFPGPGYRLAGGGGMIVGTVVALACARYRIGAVPTTAVAIVGYFLVGTAFAIPAQGILSVFPSLPSLAGLAVGPVFGWADLVTLRAPVSLPYYVNAVPYAACWLVTLVSVTLAARWLAERRRTVWRAALLLVGPTLVYLAGVLLGTEQPYFAAVRGIAFAAVSLVWLGWRRLPGPRLAVGARAPIQRRKLVGTAIILVAAIAVGGVGGTLLAPTSGQRFVLRERVQPPLEPVNYPTPLGAFRRYTKSLDETNLLRVSGLRSGQLLRLATMDGYDGVIWSVAGAETATDGSGGFRLVGRDVPPPALLTPGRSSAVEVTVLGYRDVWIPDVGYPTSFAFGGRPAADPQNVRYNSASGTAVLTTGLRRGQTYRLTAVNQKVPSDAALTDVPTANISLPPATNVPDVVRARADEIMAGATSQIDRLRTLEQELKTKGFFSHGTASDQAPSRAGHGADRMAEMLTRSSMVGDEEQYASLFALMARSKGIPARVVMGFAPKRASGAALTVTGDDVTAWVEVPFQGVGWVPFFPTPDNPDVPQDQVPKPQTQPQPQVRQPPRTPNREDDLITPVQINDPKKDEGVPFLLPGWVLVLALSILIPAAIVFLPMLVVWLIKRRRRARRREAGAEAGVAGAWDELVDRLGELGYDPPQRLTRPVLADRIGPQLPGTLGGGVVLLARRSDDAVFSGREVTAAEVADAWGGAEEVAQGAYRSVGRRRRLLSRYRLAAARRWAGRVAQAAQASASPR
ncbi:MAG: transglutaminase domain-containing protein [Micrococcales bacterium]|nr:transglutaminase domain-containing protein [Micrococcales bacterium]